MCTNGGYDGIFECQIWEMNFEFAMGLTLLRIGRLVSCDVSWTVSMGKMDFMLVMDFWTAGMDMKNLICDNVTDCPKWGRSALHRYSGHEAMLLQYCIKQGSI